MVSTSSERGVLMHIGILIFNIIGLIALIYGFYRLEKRFTSKAVLLAPILIYMLVTAEDLLGLIDIRNYVSGTGGLRALILLFCLASAVFYILYIFNKIAESAHDHVNLKSLMVRISTATACCIIFFTMIYTTVYKQFGASSFSGDGIGKDTLSQFISFLYFSVATFATVGYGDIAPRDNTARLVVIMEVCFSFITLTYALSMYSIFRKIFNGSEDKQTEREEE